MYICYGKKKSEGLQLSKIKQLPIFHTQFVFFSCITTSKQRFCNANFIYGRKASALHLSEEKYLVLN